MLQQLRLGNTWVSDQCDVDLSSDLEIIVCFFGDSASHEKEECLFDHLHAEDLRRDGVGHPIEKRVLVQTSPDGFNLLNLALVERHLHVFLLFPDDLAGLNVALEGQVVLMPESKLPLWQQNPLHDDNVPRCCLLHTGLPQAQRESPRNPAISKLIGRFLDLEFLKVPELGVSRQEGELAIDLILDALLGHALIERLVVVIKHLEVVLTAADVTGKGGHRYLWLDLAGAHNYALHHHQRAYLSCVEVADGAGTGLGVGAVDDGDVEVAMGGDGYGLILIEGSVVLLGIEVVPPLLLEDVLKLQPHFLTTPTSTSSTLIGLMRFGMISSTISEKISR